MRVIFVPVADRPECARALKYAFELAQQHGANVVGCHVRPHRGSEVTFSGLFSDEILGDSNRALETAWHKKSSAKSTTAARKLYETIAGSYEFQVSKRLKSSPVAIWQEKVGSPDKLLRISGPVSDLVVVSRPKMGGGKVASMFMFAALMESSRPVLILPQMGRSTVGQRVCIAWNQSAEAARAVAAAMPVLQRAKQVTIVTCGPENRVGPKAKQLSGYLHAWGVTAEHHAMCGQDIDQELITAYRELNSDLLVMGAYSRNRWRQVVFGGTSDYMLRRASIPVLMLHT